MVWYQVYQYQYSTVVLVPYLAWLAWYGYGYPILISVDLCGVVSVSVVSIDLSSSSMCSSSRLTGKIILDFTAGIFFLLLALILATSFSKFPLVHPNGAVLITGASSGIGLSAAKHLQSQGFHVFAACRKEKDAQRLTNVGLNPLIIDVTKESTIDEAVLAVTRYVKTSGIPLVSIINNAGSTTKKPLETVDMRVVRQVFDVNVFGALEVTQKFLPLLRETVEAGGGARIVFIGSVSGIISLPLNGVYSMTKYSMEAMADTYRRELHKFGISVSMVNPAYVNTNFRQRGADTVKEDSLTLNEKKNYGQDFAHLVKKMNKRGTFAATCCDVTDTAIANAVISAYPKTRYYPAVVAPHVPAWIVTPLIRSFGIFTMTDRILDSIIRMAF